MENTEIGFMAKKKAPVGRPSMPDQDQQVLVPTRYPRDMLEMIDAERAARLDKPSRSAMIRELVSIGLEVEGRKRR